MGYEKLTEKLFSLSWWKSFIYIVTGSFLIAAAYVFFVTPYNIVPGGVYGTGVVLHYLFPSIQVGTFGFLIDIPLLLMAFRVFGRVFGGRTIVAAVLTPLLMNLLTYFVGDDAATIFDGRINLTNDIIIACLFGGAIMGIGVGLVIKARATTGGTDIVAMTLTRYTRLTFSQGILLVDSFVVIFGIIVLGDWRLPLYSLITIFVATRTIDYVIEGASYNKLLFIISDKHQELKDFILRDLDRSATYIKSAGMYTGHNREMVFIVVSRREVALMQNQIREIDPTAFVVVVNAYETFGEGFKPFPEKD